MKKNKNCWCLTNFNIVTATTSTILLLQSAISLGNTVEYEDLFKKDGHYYIKQLDKKVFTGVVVGERTGKIVNGKREGEWTRWYENGRIRWRGNFKNGKDEGTYEKYYSNGQLQQKGWYQNGFRENIQLMYHRNGQLSVKGYFKNNREIGRWEFYNEDGTLAEVKRYDN